MTIGELWVLFPIILTAHSEDWKEWYLEEEKRLSELLSDRNAVINHIGSTAINGIWAKPIIDILVEIPKSDSMDAVKTALTQGGYICMSESRGRKSFNRGYTENGFAERVFHLHPRYFGDNDELYFRDYMNENPELAKQYEELKLSLWKSYEHDRDGYTDAKTAFGAEQTARAKAAYSGRYCR